MSVAGRLVYQVFEERSTIAKKGTLLLSRFVSVFYKMSNCHGAMDIIWPNPKLKKTCFIGMRQRINILICKYT